MKALIQEVLAAYKQVGEIVETECMKDGAPHCEVKVTFR